jgi:hypothetical protein
MEALRFVRGPVTKVHSASQQLALWFAAAEIVKPHSRRVLFVRPGFAFFALALDGISI